MQAVTFFFAFVAVLALIGVAAWLVRRFASNRLGANTSRGRMPRLAVIDASAVDGRRRLVLVRRDNVEHLIMIGGPTDIVVESHIVRAQPARDQLPQRTGSIGAEMPPPRIAPLPDAAWADSESAKSEDRPEPQMPEPPPRPVRPSFADEVRRPAPVPAERRSDRIDLPLAGFAPEPPGGRLEPRSEPRPEPMSPRLARTEPLMPRPPRSSEPPKAPASVRAPERAAAPPPPPPPPPSPPPPIPSNADQNLAEMAQRLEAALRRPAGEPVAPPVAPEPPVRPARSEAPPPPPKSGFENLEDEMASLLGRPKPSS
ncbi:MAG TPA: flagellar biosynthetic protein FliO [Bradyrhizobium sp.]|nr:flagellar biosynthetic protein FliO [Bradyrhizobium sp.]